MKKKFFALMIVWTFALNAVGTTFAAAKISETSKQGNQLTAQLPASDMVLTLNVQRLFSDALPQILSGNQPMLAEIIGKIDEVKAKTGIDLRQFEQIAVGVSSKKNAAGKMDFAPVLLARGNFNTSALLAIAKTAAKGKYREEKIGNRAVYVFTPKNEVKPNQTQSNKSSVLLPGLGIVVGFDMMKMLTDELTVSVLDNNTLAIGSLARVRETFGTAPRVGSDLLNLVNRRPNSIVNIGARFPNGMSDFVNLGNDEIGKNVAAIRYLSGALDAADGNAIFSLSAKTLQPEQAKSMQEQLDGLQMLGKSFLGSSKMANKEIYARMIENVKIARAGNEITLDLQVAQSDISVLLAKNKAQLSSSK
jgi:hypothetical protein